MSHEEAELLRAFGEAIRRARQRQGLTQETVATRADVARTYLNEVERGRRNPTLVTIGRLGTALGVPLSDLFLAVTESRRADE